MWLLCDRYVIAMWLLWIARHLLHCGIVPPSLLPLTQRCFRGSRHVDPRLHSTFEYYSPKIKSVHQIRGLVLSPSYFYVIAMWLRCDCYMIAMWLRGDCYTIAMRLSCDCYVIAIWLRYDCDVIAMRLLYDCDVIAMWLLCDCKPVSLSRDHREPGGGFRRRGPHDTHAPASSE